MVWECKHTFVTVKDENGLPGARLHLIVARNVLDPNEMKFFVSNAPPETGIGDLAAGRFFALACGALFRGPERARSAWISTRAGVTWA